MIPWFDTIPSYLVRVIIQGPGRAVPAPLFGRGLKNGEGVLDYERTSTILEYEGEDLGLMLHRDLHTRNAVG